ncbi:DNA-binding response regulator [Clostridium baratii]|uniref:Stage 0 sporulation protein A homolog n=1 Tax=Clostridium baratii TaxID=1561 RepID=A0A174SQS0_9CLOT|nr:response regulator transcription factor [Clostridium baratii]MDU1855450.1 response regulator transcription factor [Clostridium baratii]OPF50613.1 DNA-binding response regulator [Clostridium baratii]OPF54144.1 DNA-binding response regulator [Clostridium baratii]OPF58708.1 DNA-binding response regulator [Clostridium baratii]OPF58920.1 DNA-binding response regulator [Clostridium baratii]
MYNVLIVEDEENMVSFIKMELEYEGYNVDVANDGRKAVSLALEKDYDVILLDLMLPGINGIEVCRRIRKEKETPIIMLTARDSVMDKVTGLKSGADDYLAKPFAIEELIARMEVIFRRNKKEKSNSELKFKDIILDIEGRTVRRNNEVIELTNTEFQLLLMFMKNINRALTRDIIMENIWGYNSEAETNVVDVYVRYIRNKLDKNDKEKYIQTIRGVGYIMRD